ncbi:MAG TPA: hypothetical protein VMZ74_04050 [Ramlibacter sp.]|nr:hypothetical protein [Ramlibacter sp.]
MFWIRSGLHSISISDWLTAGPAVVPDPVETIGDAREAMLGMLAPQGERKYATLALRIRKAPDVHSLWALRPDLMNAACQLYGEGEARKRLVRVTAHFETLLPAAATPRKRKASGVGASR